jgi:hypothetical protein
VNRKMPGRAGLRDLKTGVNWGHTHGAARLGVDVGVGFLDEHFEDGTSYDVYGTRSRSRDLWWLME